jgi:hypothetical protein
MKLPTLFTKTPNYKRFAYTPRHYDPLEEERKEREERIRRELSISQEKKDGADDLNSYRSELQKKLRQFNAIRPHL